MTLGVTFAVHPALIVFLFTGSTWQMDSHMYFFPALAALGLLCDWRPIALASVIVAVHHLLFSFIAPAWAFSGGGDIDRVLLHASAVILQFAVLGTLTDRLRRMLINQEAALTLSGEHAEQARLAQGAAERALDAVRDAEARAAEERRSRDAAEAQAKRIARIELLRIAEGFEETVAAIVGTVQTASGELEDSATTMSGLATETGRQAIEVASAATQATANAREVASASAALSRSINRISVNVRQQSELTGVVQTSSEASDSAVRDLTQRAATISTFLDTIHGIARQTNLLALNATIEAARAGDAGRGFAVVADEVKALAAQARDATDQITGLLGSISQSAALAERSIGDAAAAVDEVVQASGTIDSEVTAQRSVAALIERNAGEAASGATMIESRIGHVATAAQAASELSVQVRDAVQRLSAGARELRMSTDAFVSHLRDEDQDERREAA